MSKIKICPPPAPELLPEFPKMRKSQNQLRPLCLLQGLSPRGRRPHLVFIGDACMTSTILNVLPKATISGLNPITIADFGLSARCPTLNSLFYHQNSKNSLPGVWPSCREGLHSRLLMRPCPAAHVWTSPHCPCRLAKPLQGGAKFPGVLEALLDHFGQGLVDDPINAGGNQRIERGNRRRFALQDMVHDTVH